MIKHGERRLRPHDEIIAPALAREIGIKVERELALLRLPFDVLRDVALHQAHLERHTYRLCPLHTPEQGAAAP